MLKNLHSQKNRRTFAAQNGNGPAEINNLRPRYRDGEIGHFILR